MSKRTRGSARAHRRPGARPPTARPAGARPTRGPAPDFPLTAERPTPLEEAPALAEEAVATETAPAAAARSVRTTHARTRAKPGSLLAARAASEYVYVGQDMRRIAIVSALLFGLMIAAWLLIVVFGVIPLDFY